MQVAQLRIPKPPNSVTDAARLESVEKKWLEAYCLFLRRPGRKREEEQWKGVCGYRGKWRLRCKTNQTTKEGGLSDGRCANTYGQQCGGPADPSPRGRRGEPQLTTPWTLHQSCAWKVWCGRVEQRWTELHPNTCNLFRTGEERVTELFFNSSCVQLMRFKSDK